MKRKTRLLFAAALLGATFGTTAAGCDLFKGNYALTDFVVNTESADLEYVVNETVDFSKLVMTATYNDDSTESVAITSVKFYLNDVDITNNLNEITKTKGEKTIVVVYSTEHGEDRTSFKVTVTEPVQEEIKTEIESLSAPYFYLEYKNAIATATNNGGTENEGKFFKNEGAEYYIVGNENAFKFLPVAVTFDEEELEEVALDSFVAQSTISVMVEGEYTELTKGAKEGETYVYEYKLGNDLIVTENATKNEYLFTSAAVDKIVKISVKPNETLYETSVNAQDIEVQVKQAYNVYNANQVAVLDSTDRTEWNALKSANGVAAASKTINGVVFHADIKITKDNIPDEFQYTLEDDYSIVYKDVANNNATGAPEDFGMDRTFLWNQYDGNFELFSREVAEGGKFAFYGNYFALDTSALPLVASFESGKTPTNVDGDAYFGSDFSNTSLFMFRGVEGTTDSADEHVTFNNLNIKGNAKQDQLLVTTGTEGFQVEALVYCGSLIFAKSNQSTTDFDNVRMQNFFISLFADNGSTANYSRAKCYDSYQNALFVWADAKVNIQKSYFERSGGPLVLAQHDEPQDAETANAYPNIVVSADSVLEAKLTGSEAWFKSITGASEIIASFVTLNEKIVKPFGKSIFDENGKMNVITLLMPNGSDPAAAMTCLDTQGFFYYGDPTASTTPCLDRRKDPTLSILGATIHGVFAGAGAMAANMPIFNIGGQVFFVTLLDANGDGTPETEAVVTPAAPTTPAVTEFAMALATADYIGVTQGGLSIMFGLSAPVQATAN